jgi:hypothetical protein
LVSVIVLLLYTKRAALTLPPVCALDSRRTISSLDLADRLVRVQTPGRHRRSS